MVALFDFLATDAGVELMVGLTLIVLVGASVIIRTIDN